MSTDWCEIVVPAAAAEVDEIAALLAGEGGAPQAAAGTEIRADEIVFWAPLVDREQALAETREVVARLAAGGVDVDPARVRAQPAMPEAEWRDAWKRYFHVTRIGRRVVIVPSWETHEPRGHDVVIDLDPGMAFGTGTHASTRLVLDAMQHIALPTTVPMQVLDVGCGSGILSIAAAKLWPHARVVAIDNDPIAVAACAENCARNGVTVECSAAPVEEIEGRFDVVLANIQAHVLYALQDAIIARAGGLIILSGLLTPQAEGVAAAYEAAGCERHEVVADEIDPQWSRATLYRR